jgi:hypothetical protein
MTQEFDYFGNPQISKLFDLTLTLGLDLHVANQRLRALEMLLLRAGVIQESDLDSFEPTPEEKLLLDQKRDEYVARLMRIITESGPSEHPLREQFDAALSEQGLKK